MMVMPMPGRSPSWTLSRMVLPGGMLRLVHEDEIGRAADLDQAAVEFAHPRGVAGGEAEREFGRHIAERRQHRDHAQDAERLHAGAGRRIGAEDDAVELAHVARDAQRVERRALVAVVDQFEAALAALADAADLVVGQGGVAAIDMADRRRCRLPAPRPRRSGRSRGSTGRRYGWCSGCRICAPSPPSSSRSGRP